METVHPGTINFAEVVKADSMEKKASELGLQEWVSIWIGQFGKKTEYTPDLEAWKKGHYELKPGYEEVQRLLYKFRPLGYW